MAEPDSKLTLFAPIGTDELLKGWQLHVARRRMVHERAARRSQRWHWWLGSIATVLVAFTGSALVSSWNADGAGVALRIAGGVTGTVTAVIVAFQTFLDLGARAERHRQSATEYKALLRRFERLNEQRASGSPCRVTDTELCAVVSELETELDRVDSRAPVVPERLTARIESRQSDYVEQARDLTKV